MCCGSWEELFSSNQLVLHNSLGVHTFQNTRNFKSTIDWTVSSSSLSSLIRDWEVQHDFPTLSDHFLIRFSIFLETPIPHTYVRNFKGADWPKLSRIIESSLHLLDVLPLNSPRQIDSAVDSMECLLRDAINKSVPLLKSDPEETNGGLMNSAS